MPRLVALALMFGTAALGACRDTSVASPPPPPSPPPNLWISAGNNQSAIRGRDLPAPLEVSVTSPDGISLTGVIVGWTVTAGGGTLSVSSVPTDGQGRASVYWTLGSVLGGQSVAATVAGLSGSPENFSATATAAPIVLHYDGTGWSTALEDVNGAHVSLASIWVATPVVFAVGNSCWGGLVLRYDGTNWYGSPTNWYASSPGCSGGGGDDVPSVWGSSASDVFAVRRSVSGCPACLPPQPGSLTSRISHYDGQLWTEVYSHSCSLGCAGVRAVWSTSRTDAFTVGDSGTILHYDGTSWSPQASGTTEVLSAVWGAGPTGAVFAVSAGGTILYYDRATWRAQTSGTTHSLNAVWGTSPSDVFAVGGAGTILHYNGTAWTAQNSGTTQSLNAVWGSSSTGVFAVGDASTILHYDGAKWAPQTIAAPMNLRGVWGSSPANVFAVGVPR